MADYLFGETEAGISSQSNNELWARKFTSGVDSNLTEIQVYSRASGNVKVAMYSDSGGSPDSLIVANDTGTACTLNQWNSIPVTSTSVSNGTDYWLVCLADTVGVISRYATSGGTSQYNGSTTYSTWTPPATYPSGTPSNFRISIAAFGSDTVELEGGTFSLTGGTVGTTQYQQLTGGTFSLTGGDVETEYDALVGGTFSLTGGPIVNSRLQGMAGGTFSLTGGDVDILRTPTGGVFSLTGGPIVNSRLQGLAGGTFSLAGGPVVTSRLQVLPGGTYTFTGGDLPDSLQTTIGLYRDILTNATEIFACDSFGNDTYNNHIWERLTSTKDLILGDGSTSSTFPTFTATSDNHTAYYAFDGVDDYLGNWPATPGFVSAAFSDSYPGGQPYVTQATDDTVKDLLTVAGAFTGNLHSLVFYSAEPTEAEKRELADYQLRRMWRDTIIDPYTARLIRNGEAVQVYDFQVVQ